MMTSELPLWIGFNLLLILFIAIDLNLHKKQQNGSRVALIASGCWVTMALLFNVALAAFKGHEAGLQFFTGYLIELSLSVDNLFVFLTIFSYFNLSDKLQHKVLFWGIIGALIMRLLCILAGITLIEKFHWILYIFGLFLIVTGALMLKKREKEFSPEQNIFLKFFRKIMPFSDDLGADTFFVRHQGKLYATQLFAVLILVEATDLLFAIDSIPAVFGVTLDPFIVYSSNAFAIVGLRSFYLALKDFMNMFSYLHYGVCFILIFIGIKMAISVYIIIPTVISLIVIGSILAISLLLSFPLKTGKQ